jgi:hypothetical protein
MGNPEISPLAILQLPYCVTTTAIANQEIADWQTRWLIDERNRKRARS